MPRSSKPRKAYKPRAVAKLPLAFKLPEDITTRLMLEPQAALVALKHGTGELDHVLTLDSRMELGLINAKRFEDPDLAAQVTRGKEVVAAIIERFKRTSRWGLNGDELRTLSTALNVCDAMHTAITRRDMYHDIHTLTTSSRT